MTSYINMPSFTSSTTSSSSLSAGVRKSPSSGPRICNHFHVTFTNKITAAPSFRKDLVAEEQYSKIEQYHRSVNEAQLKRFAEAATFPEYDPNDSPVDNSIDKTTASSNEAHPEGDPLDLKVHKSVSTVVLGPNEIQAMTKEHAERRAKDLKWRIKSYIAASHLYHNTYLCPTYGFNASVSRRLSLSVNSNTSACSSCLEGSANSNMSVSQLGPMPGVAPSRTSAAFRHLRCMQRQSEVEPQLQTLSLPADDSLHPPTRSNFQCKMIMKNKCIGSLEIVKVLMKDIETMFSVHMKRNQHGSMAGAYVAFHQAQQQLQKLLVWDSAVACNGHITPPFDFRAPTSSPPMKQFRVPSPESDQSPRNFSLGQSTTTSSSAEKRLASSRAAKRQQLSFL